MKSTLLSLLTALPVLSTSLLADSKFIIPEPTDVTFAKKNTADFVLSSNTVIVAPASLTNEATALKQALAPATGYNLKIQSSKTSSSQIKLVLTDDLAELGKEGYSLQVTPKGAIIKAPTATGIFYGVQSLLQLLPTEIVATSKQQAKWTIPSVKITDKPRFAWRAFMLDEARHFKGEKEVKKLLDQMSALKMNVFHWHLTEDQGWRIEIKKYPKLTTVGSKRKDTETGTWGSGTTSGKPHSGFYTQEEIKDIVAYAQARHITIVPEIGMPGHAVAAIAAYPILGTNKKQVEVMSLFGVAHDTYDPSAETTYTIISDIIDEVITLFPSKIIHIGGDEVRFTHWEKSASVKKLMKDKNLKSMADVQIYFTNRIAGIVQEKGLNIMGWNEILGDHIHSHLSKGEKTTNLSTDAVVHFWKGNSSLATTAIKKGHSLVNSTHSSTYLDYGYGSISLGKAYSFNPIFNGLDPKYHSKVLGFGCQMWSEWIPTVENMENKVYPRLAAYSEVGWSELEDKNFGKFKNRMKRQLERWDIQGIQYAKGETIKLTASDFFNHAKVDSWSPQQTPQDWKNHSFSTAGEIKASGTYGVAFLYSKGTHALDISEVSLLEDGKVVATDKHTAFSGGSLKRIAYTLKLPTYKAGAKYTIQARIKGSGGTDSHGEVKIQASE